jgi:hypothetical protein
VPATGFWLADAEARHAAAPRTFFIPALEDRRALTVGRYVKLLFACAPREVRGRVHDGERMWVQVVAVGNDGRYTGSLANNPIVVTELACRDLVEFGAGARHRRGRARVSPAGCPGRLPKVRSADALDVR